MCSTTYHAAHCELPFNGKPCSPCTGGWKCKASASGSCTKDRRGANGAPIPRSLKPSTYENTAQLTTTHRHTSRRNFGTRCLSNNFIEQNNNYPSNSSTFLKHGSSCTRTTRSQRNSAPQMLLKLHTNSVVARVLHSLKAIRKNKADGDMKTARDFLQRQRVNPEKHQQQPRHTRYHEAQEEHPRRCCKRKDSKEAPN